MHVFGIMVEGSPLICPSGKVTKGKEHRGRCSGHSIIVPIPAIACPGVDSQKISNKLQIRPCPVGVVTTPPINHLLNPSVGGVRPTRGQ